MDKVKEVVNKVTHPKQHNASTGTTTDSHNSGLTGTTGTTGTHGTHGTHGNHGTHQSGLTGGNHDSTLTGNTGTHSSGLTGSNNNSGLTGTTGTHNSGVTGSTGTHHDGMTGTSGTAGPHNSNLANKMDPRVDSDMDGSRNMGTARYGPGGNQHASNTGNTMTGQYDTAGPHASNLANKADPRVDSNLDGSNNMGAAEYGTGSRHTGAGMGAGTGMGAGSTFSSGNTGSTNYGTHNSNLANKVDPRFDSDLDGSRTAGHSGVQRADPLNSNASGAGFMSSSGPGPAPNTAGPHKSDMVNKIDPRVDSDLDGSKTMGKTQY